MLIYTDVAELTKSEWEELRWWAVEVFFEVWVENVGKI